MYYIFFLQNKQHSFKKFSVIHLDKTLILTLFIGNDRIHLKHDLWVLLAKRTFNIYLKCILSNYLQGKIDGSSMKFFFSSLIFFGTN